MEIQKLKEMLEKGGKIQEKVVVKYETVTKEGKMNDVKRKMLEEEQKLAADAENEKRKVQESLQNFSSER